jgi:hypothetical protein
MTEMDPIERRARLIGAYCAVVFSIVASPYAVVKVGLTSGPVGLVISIVFCAASLFVSVLAVRRERRRDRTQE